MRLLQDAGRVAAAALVALAGCTTSRVTVPPPSPLVQAPSPPLAQAWKADVEAAGGADALLASATHAIVATRKGTLAFVTLERGRVSKRASLGESLEAAPLRTDAALWVPVERGRHGLLRIDAGTGDITARLLSRTGLRATPVIVGSTLVAATTGGTLEGIDARSGQTRWTMPLGRSGFAATPIAVGETVVAATVEGRVVAVDAEAGTVGWEARVSPVDAAPALVGSTVVLPGTRGRLTGLDAATGRPAWTMVLADTTVRLGAVATVAEGRVLVGATDRQLRLVDATSGDLVWSVDLGAVVQAAPLVTDDGLAYVGTHGRRVVAVRLSDGVVVWEGRTGGRVKTAPVAAGGCLLVFAEPRHVHCFRPAADAPRP